MAYHETNKKQTVKEYKANAFDNAIKFATVIYNGKKYYNSQSHITDGLTVDYVEVSHGDVYIYAKDN
jgi:hypothetical protein